MLGCGETTVVHLNVAAVRDCGTAFLPPFHTGRSSVPYAEGDKIGSTEAPFLIAERLRPALIMAAAHRLLGNFPQFGIFLS